MTEADLFEEVSVVAKDCSSILRIRERRDWVGLGISVVRPMNRLVCAMNGQCFR